MGRAALGPFASTVAALLPVILRPSGSDRKSRDVLLHDRVACDVLKARQTSQPRRCSVAQEKG
jgi:hypothetical protein